MMIKVMVVCEDQQFASNLKERRHAPHLEIQSTSWSGWSWSAVTHQQWDVLLLDLTEPGAPIPELCAELQSRLIDLPVVLVLDGLIQHRKSLECILLSPMVDFVRRPVDPDEVSHRIVRLVARALQPLPVTGANRRSYKRTKVGYRERAVPVPAAPTSGVFRHLVSELHDPDSGRLDAKRISSLFGLRLADLARSLGRELPTVHKTPDAESLQPRLAIFERIGAALLHLAGSPEGLRIWLNAPNPELENKTPLSLLKRGEGEIVAELLEDALMGQPG